MVAAAASRTRSGPPAASDLVHGNKSVSECSALPKIPRAAASSRSVWLMKITLSGGSTRLLLNAKWEREEPRQRGSHTEGDKSDQCACQPGAVWISYPAAPSAPAIVEDTSTSASRRSPRVNGRTRKSSVLSPRANPPKKTTKKKERKKQWFSIVTSDTMNTCSALITIPCFSEIVSDAIFSPNYFPLLWGMGSRLEPEEAARAGQIGGWWARDYLEGYREGHLHCRVEEKEVHFRVNVHFNL